MNMILIWEHLNTKGNFKGGYIYHFSWKEKFTAEAGSFIDFARSYKKFGLNIDINGNLVYREWAPGAREVSLVRSNYLSFIL